MAAHIKKWIKLKKQVPFLCQQLKSFKVNPSHFVVLFHVDKKVEGKAKVLGVTNELCNCVKSCRLGSNYKNWFDFDRSQQISRSVQRVGLLKTLFLRLVSCD